MLRYLIVLSGVVHSCTSFYQEHGYELKKVLVMSRHNLRTPLSRDLPDLTPKSWPVYKEGPGILTEKGKVLEGYMGTFFSEWLRNHCLLSNECPTEDDVYIYTNVIQRTKVTGQAFVYSAFPHCHVEVHHGNGETDPIFLPSIHNHTDAFKRAALELMYRKRNALKLTHAFTDLNSVLNYNESYNCRIKKQCDLASDYDKIILQDAGRAALMGPLKYGNIATDAFIMAYFNGFENKDVAWGLINDERWKNFVSIMTGYHNVLFNISLVAKDVAKPLITYIKEKVLNDSPKFTLLVGHDSNIYCLLTAMKFKPYSLSNQLEVIPIGGKIVFQKWYDQRKNRNLLKINYVYQSNEQLRNSVPLSSDNPPQIIELELEECKVDSSGYCLWDDFENFLNNLYG